MKKVVRSIIIIATAIFMLCVWPLCIVRKEIGIYPQQGISYAETEQYITADSSYMQTFTAQTEKLNGITVILNQMVELSKVDFLVELIDEEGKQVYSKQLNLCEMGNQIPVNKWLKKGREYTIKVSVPEEANGAFKCPYTVKEEQHAVGSKEFRIGEQVIDGQAVVLYEYAFPLNAKNIACLWAFILIIGISLYGLVQGENRDEESSTED